MSLPRHVLRSYFRKTVQSDFMDVVKDYAFVVRCAGDTVTERSSHLNVVVDTIDGERAVSIPFTNDEYQQFLNMTTGSNDFYYSNKYEDDEYEYRHVHVTKEVAKLIPKNRLMSETEWRSLGIQQSPGWVHYMIHGPERHVLLFRRALTTTAIQANKTQPQKSQFGVGVR